VLEVVVLVEVVVVRRLVLLADVVEVLDVDVLELVDVLDVVDLLDVVELLDVDVLELVDTVDVDVRDVVVVASEVVVTDVLLVLTVVLVVLLLELLVDVLVVVFDVVVVVVPPAWPTRMVHPCGCALIGSPKGSVISSIPSVICVGPCGAVAARRKVSMPTPKVPTGWSSENAWKPLTRACPATRAGIPGAGLAAGPLTNSRVNCPDPPVGREMRSLVTNATPWMTVGSTPVTTEKAPSAESGVSNTRSTANVGGALGFVTAGTCVGHASLTTLAEAFTGASISRPTIADQVDHAPSRCNPCRVMAAAASSSRTERRLQRVASRRIPPRLPRSSRHRDRRRRDCRRDRRPADI